MEKPVTKVETKAVSTWPADDVTLIQRVYKDDKLVNHNYIGLRLDEVDDFIAQILVAVEDTLRMEKQLRDYEEGEKLHKEGKDGETSKA